MFAHFKSVALRIALFPCARLHAEGCVPGQSRKIEGVEERLEYEPNTGESTLAVSRMLRPTSNVFAVNFRVDYRTDPLSIGQSSSWHRENQLFDRF